MVTHSPTLTPTQRQTLAWVAAMLMLWTPQTNLLLRDCAWLEDHHAHVGGTVWLNMPEMGVEGLAEVLAIEPCPPLEEGEGRLVTGTFRHTSGEVYDLKLESESKPIGVTATHPFWSVNRREWVSGIDLEVGETLKTLEGTTVVESRRKRTEQETVFNIEVEGDHVYRVGESGVLVHNASWNRAQIQQGGTGYSEYAEPARDYRVNQGGVFVQGWRNLGAVVYKDPSGTRKRHPTTAFVIGRTTNPAEHAEQRIRDYLEASGYTNCSIKVIELFTERTPCRSCEGALDEIAGLSTDDFTVLWIGPLGADANGQPRLVAAYASIGLPLT